MHCVGEHPARVINVGKCGYISRVNKYNGELSGLNSHLLYVSAFSSISSR